MFTSLSFFTDMPKLTLFYGYIIGMIVIGYPMGLCSLRVWKECWGRGFQSFLLFPWRTAFGGVGSEPETSAKFLSFIHATDVSQEVLRSEHEYAMEVRADYIASTMVVWLPRLITNVLIITFLLAVAIVCAIGGFLSFCLRKLLLLIPECVRL